MFFEQDDLSARLLSVLSLSWEEVGEKSDLRPFHALSFRVKGNAEFEQGEYSWKAGDGDIFFVPAYFEYELRAKNEELFVIHFESDAIPADKICKFHPKNPWYFEELFRELFSDWTKKAPGYLFGCKALFYKILYAMEREFSERENPTGTDKLRPAMEYLHEHFTDSDLSVERLARLVGVSEVTFRQLFFRSTGTTPKKYICDLKKKTALELLGSGYYTVGEVADRCGFQNAYYFSNFLKKETGKSPKNFLTKKENI